MAHHYNNITLIGNIGREPELRYLPDGTAVLSFSLAVSRPSKRDASGNFADVPTDWFAVSIWRQAAEAASKVLTKGTRLFINGPLYPREYEAKDGTKRVSYDVTANTWVPMVTRKDDATTTDADDVPF